MPTYSLRLGFEEIRQRGSQVVMQRSESGCVVPMHGEIKVGILAGVLKQAGVSVEEFIGALGQQAMANTDPYLWQKVDSLG